MECGNCGTPLPDEALFCLKCGRPVRPNPVTPPSGEPRFAVPAIIGGVSLGLLSSLPLVSAGNLLCCMWIVGGGALAARRLAKQKADLSRGDGAFVGVLAGLVGAVVATAFSIPLRVLVPQLMAEQQAMVEGMPDLDPGLRDFMMRVLSPEISALSVAFVFFSNLIVFSLFAMIGGVLMASWIRSRGSGGGSQPASPPPPAD